MYDEQKPDKTLSALLCVCQKEDRIKKEDSEGRGRENDNGCSPATPLATRRMERPTPAEGTGQTRPEARGSPRPSPDIREQISVCHVSNQLAQSETLLKHTAMHHNLFTGNSKWAANSIWWLTNSYIVTNKSTSSTRDRLRPVVAIKKSAWIQLLSGIWVSVHTSASLIFSNWTFLVKLRVTKVEKKSQIFAFTQQILQMVPETQQPAALTDVFSLKERPKLTFPERPETCGLKMGSILLYCFFNVFPDTLLPPVDRHNSVKPLAGMCVTWPRAQHEQNKTSQLKLCSIKSGRKRHKGTLNLPNLPSVLHLCSPAQLLTCSCTVKLRPSEMCVCYRFLWVFPNVRGQSRKWKASISNPEVKSYLCFEKFFFFLFLNSSH